LIEDIYDVLHRSQAHSIQMCLTVRGEWQIWHPGWFCPFRRYELVSLVWLLMLTLLCGRSNRPQYAGLARPSVSLSVQYVLD